MPTNSLKDPYHRTGYGFVWKVAKTDQYPRMRMREAGEGPVA